MTKLNNFFIKVKSANLKEIKSFSKKLTIFLKKSKSIFKGPIFCPTKTSLINVLKSPHKDKDSRDQFGLKRYKEFFYIKKIYKSSLYEILNFNISSELNVIIC
ncbi:30S ribosomal protein S10 [Candidatus Vidania fulgoroideorum]